MGKDTKVRQEMSLMIELKGKYNSAKIFTDIVDEASIAQVMLLLNQEFVAGSRIRLMPDIHAGAGCTIGTTMTIRDKIVPNLVGVDIGCGMECVILSEKEMDLKKLDAVIHDQIPAGFNIRSKAHPYIRRCSIEKLYCASFVDLGRAEKSLGTLGGGNHFIEVNIDEEGNRYLVIHTGSRHLGLEVAKHYQNMAYEALNSLSKDEEKIIKELKAKGMRREIEKTLRALKNVKRTHIPKELAFVSGELFTQYIHDMQIVQEYAAWNRKAIKEDILNYMGLTEADGFTTIHNYIDTDAMILRKGAVSAKTGERLIIPINMRDGSLMCTGKGNDDWNQSAPHGAGRLMSRSRAKEQFTVSEFEQQMEGIYTTSVGRETLDECPMAYKGMDDIVSNIGDTAEINLVIRPIYNFKAGGD